MTKRKRGRPPNKFVLGQNENGEPIYKTYKEMGITRRYAWKCRMYAAIPKDLMDELLDRPEGPPNQTTLIAIGRHFSGLDPKPDKRFNIKPDDPANAAWQIAKQCGVGYVEELIYFLKVYLERAQGDPDQPEESETMQDSCP